MESLHSLLVHPSDFSSDDVVINKDIFGHIKVGDFIKVTDPECITNRLILKVLTMQTGRLEISISKQIADLLNLKPFGKVYVSYVEPSDAEVDYVELSFRRQFLQVIKFHIICFHLGKPMV
jgi:hypothetical protein